METNQPATETTPAKPDTTPKGLNPVEILELHEKGLTKSQIAKVKGCSVSAVKYHLRDIHTKFCGLDKFKAVQSDLLRMLVKDMVFSLTTGKVKEMGGRDLVVSIGILIDKIRLLEGETTQNIGFKGIMLQVTDNLDKMKHIETRIAELRDRAGLQSVTGD